MKAAARANLLTEASLNRRHAERVETRTLPELLLAKGSMEPGVPRGAAVRTLKDSHERSR